MGNATLVGPNLEAGRELIKALDASGLDVRAAFWFYREESEEWRMYIATPLVKEQGPREAYSRILNALRKNSIHSIDLSNISVIDPTDGLATVLSLAIANGPHINEISFNGDTVNGVYIRAAHIYRMNIRPS
jgi:hypothetical protein